jgi:hypothetical protein
MVMVSPYPYEAPTGALQNHYGRAFHSSYDQPSLAYNNDIKP